MIFRAQDHWQRFHLAFCPQQSGLAGRVQKVWYVMAGQHIRGKRQIVHGKSQPVPQPDAVRRKADSGAAVLQGGRAFLKLMQQYHTGYHWLAQILDLLSRKAVRWYLYAYPAQVRY